MTAQRARLAPWQAAAMAATAAFCVLAVVLEVAAVAAPAIFAAAALGTIGLAWLVGLATEQLAAVSSPKLSALLNAAFGNIAELVLVLLAVRAGLGDVAKASIAGSVIGNALFVLGLAFLVGGLRHGMQRFNRELASLTSVLLVVAVLGLGIPTMFEAFATGASDTRLQGLSDGVAVIFLVLYVIYVRYFFRSADAGHDAGHDASVVPWSRRTSLIALLVAGVGVGFLGEILIGSLEPTAEAVGLSPVFMGLIAIPVIGNLAEHLVAVQLAAKGRMDFAVNVAMGSTLQVVMFIAPVLALVSPLLGDAVPLTFTPLEIVALGGGALVTALVAADGESTWVEGSALLGVYLMVGLAALLWPA